MKHSYLSLAFIISTLFISTSARAQSWLDLLNKENVEKVISTVTESSTTTNITGSWLYTGSAVEFKSDNLLKKAGGAVASSTAEQELDAQLAKVGIKPGLTNFVFNTDSTFTSTIGKKSMRGTYSYNASAQTVNLKYLGLVGLNAKVNCTSSTLSLLFEADKLLKLLTYFGNKTSSSTLKAISSLASSYDGMLLGLEMKKQ